MSIYTRKGDTGRSSLFGVKRLYKDDIVFEVLGEIDCLNALLGLFITKKRVKKYNILKKLQRMNYRIMGLISGDKRPIKDLNTIIKEMEQTIDYIMSKKKKLNRFLIFNKNEDAAFANFLRCKARTVERRFVHLARRKREDLCLFIPFYNRLSDLLFAISRDLESKETLLEI